MPLLLEWKALHIEYGQLVARNFEFNCFPGYDSNSQSGGHSFLDRFDAAQFHAGLQGHTCMREVLLCSKPGAGSLLVQQERLVL